jgi:sugar-specific transcriptional regulator TrmB
MHEMIQTLLNLGLNEKEARTYITLLELGSSSAYKVSQKSGIKKPTTYVVLEELRKKGMVLKTPGKTKTLYKAQNPEELFEKIESTLTRSKRILPRLVALSNQEKEVKTYHYEGLEGMRQIFHYNFHLPSMNNSEFVGFYAKAENVAPDYLDLFHEWNKDSQEKNISFRIIAPDNKSLKQFRALDKESNREVRVISEDIYSSEVSFDTNGEFVRIVDIPKQQGVILENPRIAKALKEIFEMVWSKE